MVKWDLCDYSDAYILFKWAITVEYTGTTAALNNTEKKVMFKNCGPFTDCISEINNKEMDHAKDIDVVMLMYNLTEYKENYSKTSGSLWQYYRNEPFLNNEDIIDVPDDPDSASFKYKLKTTAEKGNNGTKDVQIMTSFKYLRNFWRTLEMPLIN